SPWPSFLSAASRPHRPLAMIGGLSVPPRHPPQVPHPRGHLLKQAIWGDPLRLVLRTYDVSAQQPHQQLREVVAPAFVSRGFVPNRRLPSQLLRSSPGCPSEARLPQATGCPLHSTQWASRRDNQLRLAVEEVLRRKASSDSNTFMNPNPETTPLRNVFSATSPKPGYWYIK